MNPARLDYQAEKLFFISVKRSPATRSQYKGALRIFEDWLRRKDFSITELTPERAADFIRHLETRTWPGSGGPGHVRTAMRVRAIVSACSSFYSHLHKHFPELGNPFLRSREVRMEASSPAADGFFWLQSLK